MSTCGAVQFLFKTRRMIRKKGSGCLGGWGGGATGACLNSNVKGIKTSHFPIRTGTSLFNFDHSLQYRLLDELQLRSSKIKPSLDGTKPLKPSLPSDSAYSAMATCNKMYRSFVTDSLRVEVKHRCPAPNRYTWEICSEDKILPVDESTDRFRSWEEAYQVGNRAMRKLLVG